MKKPYLVANWKMNGSCALLTTCLPYWETLHSHARVVVCPPFPLLASAQVHIGAMALGAQDCHPEQSGAFTGAVSASILAEVGCQYVIVGHSERRQYNGESSALVKSKAQAALACGLTPIICVGEPLEVYEGGKTLPFIQTQIAESCPTEGPYIIAYEPIWAIGTGKAASPADIENVHAFIKSQKGSATPVLYGGSVNSTNARSFLEQPSVDGLLVGGASLKRDEFGAIITCHV